MRRHSITVPIAVPAGHGETHPRAIARGTQKPAVTAARVIVYSPIEAHVQWAEAEAARAGAVIQLARTVGQVVAALVDDPPPRPQILVIDLDALSPGELMQLHQVREQGWCGVIVALGRVPAALRGSLKITRSIPPPYVEHALSDEIDKHRSAVQSKTTRMSVIPI